MPPFFFRLCIPKSLQLNFERPIVPVEAKGIEMARPKLTNLETLTIPIKRGLPRIASLCDLSHSLDQKTLKINQQSRPISKPQLTLIVNPRPEAQRRSNFGQMMGQFCDSLDCQIEEILRM